MKIGRIIPLHKSGVKTVKSNYRPISTLPFLSKVYERVIHTRLLKFLTKFGVLYPDQYGFLKNKSTTDAILKFSDCCYANFNDKNFLISVFLDFSRAFDTIDHDIMCRKLERCGVRGSMNEWFKSYFRGRSQYVEVAGTRSSLVNIRCSVPQGSILGPLCFLVYIKDMNRSSDPVSYTHLRAHET